MNLFFQQLRSLFSISLVALLCSGCVTPPQERKLVHVEVLPLALDDHFAFRKETQFLNDPATFITSHNEALSFIRRSYSWPATTKLEEDQLKGEYFNFYWWNHGPAKDVTLRLEYRQQGLGNYVLARELFYPHTTGSVSSHFKITGDDYLENGKVTSWRALLIVDHKIVGLTQSFLWQ